MIESYTEIVYNRILCKSDIVNFAVIEFGLSGNSAAGSARSYDTNINKGFDYRVPAASEMAGVLQMYTHTKRGLYLHSPLFLSLANLYITHPACTGRMR